MLAALAGSQPIVKVRWHSVLLERMRKGASSVSGMRGFLVKCLGGLFFIRNFVHESKKL